MNRQTKREQDNKVIRTTKSGELKYDWLVLSILGLLSLLGSGDLLVPSTLWYSKRSFPLPATEKKPKVQLRFQDYLHKQNHQKLIETDCNQSFKIKQVFQFTTDSDCHREVTRQYYQDGPLYWNRIPLTVFCPSVPPVDKHSLNLHATPSLLSCNEVTRKKNHYMY